MEKNEPETAYKAKEELPQEPTEENLEGKLEEISKEDNEQAETADPSRKADDSDEDTEIMKEHKVKRTPKRSETPIRKWIPRFYKKKKRKVRS